ncbi:MAG: hypothetical protein LBU11_05860 [Zoogloeaceae bacterium]|jgi:hypothetical protein|nr:hypothetical protein [Zoogloeaceae bacterium]
MRRQKFLSFLLALFVMSAAFPGNMALASGVKNADESYANTMSADCHETMTADADLFPARFAAAHDHDADSSSHGHDAPMAEQGDCAHGCSDAGCASIAGCSSFVGLFSLTGFSFFLPSAWKTIPFQLSPHPDACNAGIYHPPRQNA